MPVAGVTAHQVVLAPGFELDYTVSHCLVVVSTRLGGIAAVVHHTHALADDSRYEATLGDHPDQLASLLFFNLNQLLSLGEQAGLIGDTPLAALRPDLQKIHLVGMASSRGESDTTTELLLKIQ